jgi:hypothetical protein
MTDPVVTSAVSAVKAAATADVAKAESWFSKGNLYPFAIGAGSAAAVVKVLHLVGLLKFI